MIFFRKAGKRVFTFAHSLSLGTAGLDGNGVTPKLSHKVPYSLRSSLNCVSPQTISAPSRCLNIRVNPRRSIRTIVPGRHRIYSHFVIVGTGKLSSWRAPALHIHWGRLGNQALPGIHHISSHFVIMSTGKLLSWRAPAVHIHWGRPRN
jgi:hypothetical protein